MSEEMPTLPSSAEPVWPRGPGGLAMVALPGGCCVTTHSDGTTYVRVYLNAGDPLEGEPCDTIELRMRGGPTSCGARAAKQYADLCEALRVWAADSDSVPYPLEIEQAVRWCDAALTWAQDAAARLEADDA